MKLLLSTLFTMLIIGSAGVSYGQDIRTQKLGDEIYVGEMKNGLFEGQGSLSYNNILVYSGEFKENLYHGPGKLKYEDDSVYIGQFKYGLRSGFGTYTDTMGKVMSGTWVKDVLKIPSPPIASNSEPLVNERIQEQCISFGFRVDTDDMANCILQLYLKSEVDSEAMTTKKAIEDQVRNNRLQAERLAEQQRQQQEYAREQARIRNADLAEQKRQQEDQKRQRAARALYNLGMDIANPRRGNTAAPVTRSAANCVLSSDPSGRVYTFSGIGCPSGYISH